MGRSHSVDPEGGDATAKLQQLIEAYNQSGNRENEAERAKSLSQAKHESDLEADRQELLKNGVPIDPDLIAQATGGDRSSITIPKVVLDDRDNGQAKSTDSRQSVLQSSSGETIRTDRVVIGHTHEQTDQQVEIKPDDNRIYSQQTARSNQREIKKVLRRARRRYGGDSYNRLDPASYASGQAAIRKKQRSARRIRTAVAVVAVLIGAACGVGFLLYKQANPPLKYTVNYCTEQDVINAIQNYNNGDVQAITSYLAGKVGNEQYSQDAKCAYIGALEFALNGVESGIQYQQGRFDSSADKGSVDELITRYDGPTMDSLNNTANDKSGGDEEDDVPSQDGTLLEESVSGDVPN